MRILKSILLGIAVAFSACTSKEKADLIVTGAKIYTVDSAFSTAESFAVRDGKFIAIGKTADILARFDAVQIIDAKGKTVLPGIIDSHCHFYGYGQGLQNVNLVGTKSFDEVLERVKKFSAASHSKWIVGRGWDQNDWTDKTFPDNRKLDSLFPDQPVLLERIDGHAALVNSKALELAGVTAATSIEGGVIEKRKPGKDQLPSKNNASDFLAGTQLTGLLVDNAVDLVKSAIPKPGKEEIKRALLAAEKNCFAAGITTVDDAGLDRNIIEAMNEFQQSGELRMRIYAMISDTRENLDFYLRRGIFKTERLNVRSVKLYADGALGSRGACLRQPYSDMNTSRGFLLNTIAHFDSVAHECMLRGFQVNTHCIGDSAVKVALGIAMQQSKRKDFIEGKGEKMDLRWRIEHFQVFSDEDLAALKATGIIPSVQPTHATSDMYWAGDRLGAERIANAYAYKKLLAEAGTLALGTDFPVESIEPMYTFYAAVVRKDLKGSPVSGFQMENALDRISALRGMTIWGAHANFEEKEKGSIEVGKFADFIIMDTDIMSCNEAQIPKAKVLNTFLNGDIVYTAP
jgi:predicted amidohydrolase YtcJ